ncbi:galactose-6-phosphate isomerase subunit LacA 2 [Bacilli bacterium]|nr:galactose-6-phosphate isomerase subunit LacA 2 [Bacilli bacterium]
MKIGLISNQANEANINLLVNLIDQMHHEPVVLNKHDAFINNCDELIKNIQTKNIERGIVIDDYGILPFMYIAKTKGIVVAEISDEHSARMTCEHNNATVLSFGSEISTMHQIKNMVQSFLNAQYEGGRHQVRIDMMNTLMGGK